MGKAANDLFIVTSYWKNEIIYLHYIGKKGDCSWNNNPQEALMFGNESTAIIVAKIIDTAHYRVIPYKSALED